MAKNCPICNFKNPYGAQVCGDCGHELITPQIQKRDYKGTTSRASSDIEWASIGLKRIDKELGKEKKPLFINILTLSLFSYGLIILILSTATWFRPVFGWDFIVFHEHLYPLLIGIFLGILTIFFAFGVYRDKKRILRYYFIWVGIQLLLLFMLRSGLWRLSWFGLYKDMIFSMIISVQVLLFPVFLKLKNRF